MANKKYHILTINTGSEYETFQDLLLHLQDDPKYSKKWPCITSSDLLKQLQDFMSSVIINGFGTENGVLFVKPNRRQVDGSHRYYFCKESPDGEVFLYKKFGAGPDKGKFLKIFTNKEESTDMLTYMVNYMKHEGEYPTIKTTEQYYEDAQIMVARERIQICLNMVHSGVDITHRKTNIDYAIDLLPNIKAPSMTPTTVTRAKSPSEQKDSSLSPRSSLSSSAIETVSSPPVNIGKKIKKRTNVATDHSNSLSTQTTECPTPITKRLRGRKQDLNNVISTSSNATASNITCYDSLQESTSSSATGGTCNKKILTALDNGVCETTLTVYNNAAPKKKSKTRRRK